MNRILIVLSLAALSLNVQAQTYSNNPQQNSNGDNTVHSGTLHKGRTHTNSKLYINLSSGINNNAGILGVGLEFCAARHISVEAGIGISSWGSKSYLAAKYFFRPDHLGWAIGPGITYNSGINPYTSNLETIDGSTESVTLNLKPVTNFFLAAYKYWYLGRYNNRVYMELGYSLPLTSDRFDQVSGTPISDNATNALNLISPGGVIIGVGLCFGTGHHR